MAGIEPAPRATCLCSAQLPACHRPAAHPRLHPHSCPPPPARRRQLAESGLGQLRASLVEGGIAALLEVFDAEAVPVSRACRAAVRAGLERRVPWRAILPARG